MKIVAYYLPQFHAIPENDQWWGEGFTEWTNVKGARPLFEGHNQPRVPAEGRYYDLTDGETLRWQVDLAQKYGVYAFCFYHYWFKGRQLLESPVDAFLRDPTLDFPFCLSWPNGPWTRAWASRENEVLMPQEYGNEEDWDRHLDYLLEFWRDDRYIKIDGKPLFLIYSPELIPDRSRMLEYYQERARREGFPGICFGYQGKYFHMVAGGRADHDFEFAVEYQPSFAFTDIGSRYEAGMRFVRKQIVRARDKLGLRGSWGRPKKLRIRSYDDLWSAVLRRTPTSRKSVPGAFVDWDDTPRRGESGSVAVGATPEKFYAYMSRQIRRARDVYQSDWLFLFAWNEWAESGYLEPDSEFGHSYLQALRRALADQGELGV